MDRDELTKRLLPIFLGELEEHIRALTADLLALEKDPSNPAHLKVLFRVAHTLKGGARAAGVPLVEQLCHALEGLLAEARDGRRVLGPDDFALLFSAADALADASQRMREGRRLSDSPVAELVGRLGSSRSRAAPEPAVRPGRPRRQAAEPLSVPATAPAEEPPPRRNGKPAAPDVRVGADRLGGMMAAAAQLDAAARRLSARPAELQEFRALATRVESDWRNLRSRLAGTLQQSEGTGLLVQVQRLEGSLRRLLEESAHSVTRGEEDARLVALTADEMVHRALQLRLRPFADACETLPRVVRDVATAAGKEAEFVLEGGDVQADRVVLERLRDPLIHLVRNAVDHGIEPPEKRERIGKPRTGTVRVAVVLRANRLVVEVSDDGAGPDLPTIRSMLEKQGQAAPASDHELVHALFTPGMSTRMEASEISGRGVGLDVVRASVEGLLGTVDVRWEAGRGITFVLECPLTLATTRVVLVRLGSQTLAIPTGNVERLGWVRRDEIRRTGGRDVVPGPEVPVPLASLAGLIGLPIVQPPAGEKSVVVHLLSGGHRLVVEVDEILAEQEVVVQPLGRIRKRPPYLSGATVLATGRPAVVINVAPLIESDLKAPRRAAIAPIRQDSAESRRPRILVVDDSISTRALEQSILEAAGYEVSVAVDGEDAWRILQERGADLVVSDVEMPRMDGLALCKAIRDSRGFTRLPVVLVSALESPEHRARGLEVGADAYIAKSGFDQEELLDTIRQLIG